MMVSGDGHFSLRRLTMNRTAIAFAAIVLAVVPAFAQIAGVKQDIQGKLNGAVDQHNQDLDNAMNGDNPQQPQQPQQPQPAAPDAITAGWITRAAKDGKTNVRLYFAYPQNLSKDHPAAGLLLIQEWWGVNDDIQERTREFAKHGYYAVAPDLYNGKATDDPKVAAELHDGLKDDAALLDMQTGLDLFTEESSNGVIDPSRVGVIGWCMGGQQALLLSIADPRVKATAIFYGPLVTDPDKLKNLQGPILGIFGNNDTHPSPADVEKFKLGLTAAGKTDVTIYQFDGVGHAFASKAAEKMGMYYPDKAKDAWDKTWAWVDAKLPKK
jgi:carboxymethylenebutenolidase